MAASSNNPSLVAKALAKAQSVESRLNNLVNTSGPQPTVLYSGGNTVVTQNVDGNYTWTCPAGVTSALVECWGAGGGGGGGSNTLGGEGGGGGAYSAEPLFVTIPGHVYNYVVGNGGAGGPGGGGTGTSGGDTSFNNDLSDGGSVGVYAHGGDYTEGPFLGGNGGNGSANTISHRGGNGGGDHSQLSGGCGGGGSSGMTGTGGDATDSTGSTGSPGGSGGSGGGAAGGNGGNSGANGSAGSSPGGGGGGVGANSATSITKTYNSSGCRSYYGSDGSNPNFVRTTNSTMYHGGTTAGGGSFNGTQKSIITFPTAPTIVNDFSGATATSASVKLVNEHTYFSSGMSLQLRTWLAGGGAPSSWNGSSSSSIIYNTSIGENQTKSFSLGATVAAGFIAGTNFGIAIGPGPNQMDNNWYGYFFGAGGGNTPTLTITGTTGISVGGGAGADGQVKITYQTQLSSTPLVAALQANATTDVAGNALAAGLTGQTTAVKPGSSPAVLETWNTSGVSLPTGITGTCRYRLLSDNHVEVHVNLTIGSSAASGAITLITLPTGYIPSVLARGPCGFFTNGPTTVSQLAGMCNMRWSANTGGTFTVQGFAGGATTTGVTELDFMARYPLD